MGVGSSYPRRPSTATSSGLSSSPAKASLVTPSGCMRPSCLSATLPLMATIRITGDAAADGLLSKEPLALVLGMLLDQQFPMEAAFSGPWKLSQRLGHLDAQRIAEMDTDELVAAMRIPPVVHRYPASMGGRVQEL